MVTETFNRRRQVDPARQTYGIVNLVVDVQYGTDPAFLERVRQSADKLRERGIPTIWITMSDRSQLYPPAPASTPPVVRDAAQLEEQGFLAHGPSVDEDDLRRFRDHLANLGPKADEAVFPKAFFNSFASAQDLSRAALRDHFTGQRQAEYAIDIDKAFHGQSLQDYLKGLGTKQVTIMGGNADVCVSETSWGAAVNGFRATILSDHVISHGDQAGNRPPAQYQSELNTLRGQITDSPQELADNPTKQAFAADNIFSDEDKRAIRRNVDVRTFDDFLSSFSGPKTSSAPTPPVMQP